MSFSAGAVRVRLHPLLPAIAAAAVLTGHGVGLLAGVLALLLHESGHGLAARCLGLSISELEFTPFGGVMTVEDADRLSPLRRILFSAAGPAFSFLGCFSAGMLLQQGAPFSWAQRFAGCNLLLCLVNLLPALPLDGGEMLLALLTLRFPRALAARILSVLGYCLGALLAGLSLAAALQGELLLSPLAAGLYLIYAVSIQGRESTGRYLSALIGRRQKIENGEALPVEWLAVGEDTAAGKLLRRLSPGKYHMLLIVSKDGTRCLGTLDEQAYCHHVMARPDAAVGQSPDIRKTDGLA